jgi:hypothetical protein
MKTIKIFLLILLYSCNTQNKKIANSDDFPKIIKDTLTYQEIDSLINNLEISRVDSSSFMSYFIGENKSVTIKKTNLLLESRKLFKSNNQIYFYLPIEEVHKEQINLKCIVDFGFNENILETVRLKFSIPFTYFQPHLIKLKELPNSVSGLDEYIRSKDHQSEYKIIQMNAGAIYNYLKNLSNLVAKFYKIQYDKPYIKENISSYNNSIISGINVAKSNDLIWIINGKVISLFFSNEPYLSEQIAIKRYGSNQEIFIGYATYTNIHFYKKKGKNENPENLEPFKENSSKNNKKDSSLKLLLENKGI